MSEGRVMRKIIVGWVVLAAAMLVPSAVIGQLLNLAMPMARDPDFIYTGRAAPPAPPPAPPRPPAQGPAEFPPPTAVPAEQKDALARPLLVLARPREEAMEVWTGQFDTDRMIAEEGALGFSKLRVNAGPAPAGMADFLSIRDDLRLAHQRGMVDLPLGAVEVVRASYSPDSQDALVIAKHTATENNQRTVRYVRWWMTQATGEWRVYDFDMPQTRLRFLAVRNYLFQRSADGGKPEGYRQPDDPKLGTDAAVYDRYQSGVGWLALAGGTANDPAYDRAREAEADFTDDGQIDAVIAARKAFQQRLAAMAGKANAAATYASLAKAKWPDTPYRFLAAATNNNKQKRYTEAFKNVKEFRAAVGDDPEAYREEATARAGMTDDPKVGVAVIQMGLLEFPGDAGLLFELARRVPGDERAAVGEMIAKSAPQHVLPLAGVAFANQPAVFDALCTGFVKARPSDRDGQEQAVHAKVALGQRPLAATLLKKARDADPAAWPAFIQQLARDPRVVPRLADYYTLFADLGEADAAYRAIARRYEDLARADPKAATMGERVKELAALNALHAAARPDDPELGLWKATVLWAEGDAAKADAELAAAMKQLKPSPPRGRPVHGWDDDQAREWGWEAYRRLRTRCLVKLGNWQQAYDDLPPAMDTFDQLAAQFRADRNATALGDLVERHGKKAPDDAEVLFWRGTADFMKKNYGPAVKAFKDYLANPEAKADRFREATEKVVRALVRLDRPDDAMAVVNEWERLNRSIPLWGMVAIAANNDIDRMLEILDRGPWVAAKLYDDEDAGPLLQKPAFARVRQKYPPPVR